MEANDELRAEYHWQKKMARDLRKILMKRVNIAVKFDYVFYNMQAPSAGQVLANSAFDRLVRDLVPMARESERFQGFLQDRERRHGTHTFREWNVRRDLEAHEGLFLELVNSYALPFDFALISDAVKRQFGEGTTHRTDTSFCEYFNHAGDATVHQSIVRLDNTKGRYNVRFREVVRNIRIGATHLMFLSTKLIEPVTFAGEPIRSMIVREKKWTVVRGSSSGDPDGDDMTSVQSYHAITPEVIYEGFEGEWTRRKLEGEMIPAWNVTLDTVHRRLESDLIEQSMRSSPRSLLPSFAGCV
uniref:Uncharacterized protein n=1 Tax=Globisporangium ultimum (strain ATCC 200006 / CBS 805.95 / DAOM BR144) TaxID=431595 RepID=K3W8Y2_GLOUD